MKKFTTKTRIALSLLLTISMASASQRSWTNRAKDTWESGREYARPVYNYARNNPKTAAAIGVGVGTLTYLGYKAYKSRIRSSRNAYYAISKAMSDARTWLEKFAPETRHSRSLIEEQRTVLELIQRYNNLINNPDSNKSEIDEASKFLLKKYRELSHLQDRLNETEKKTFQALQTWVTSLQ